MLAKAYWRRVLYSYISLLVPQMCVHSESSPYASFSLIPIRTCLVFRGILPASPLGFEEGNWGQSGFYRRAHHSAVLTLDDVTQGIRKEDANKGKGG